MERKDKARKRHTWPVLPQPLPLGSGGILNSPPIPHQESRPEAQAWETGRKSGGGAGGVRIGRGWGGRKLEERRASRDRLGSLFEGRVREGFCPW